MDTSNLTASIPSFIVDICRRESGYSSPANTPSSVHGGGMEAFEFPESVR